MVTVITQSGIDKDIAILLFMTPIIITLISISRHVLGLRSLGIYLTYITALILFQFGYDPLNSKSDIAHGLSYGIPLIILTFASSAIVYTFMKKWAVHYYPKLALLVTIVAGILISVLLLLGLINKGVWLELNIFSLILLVGLCEKYMGILVRKNLKTTIIISLESILTGVLCFLLISWEEFYTLIFSHPYLLILLLPVNYFIGKYTGLRISEYFRFLKILEEKE